MPSITKHDVELITGNLKLLRQAMRWTQEDLAKRVGVTRQTITAIENGKQVPSETLIVAVLGLFVTVAITSPLFGKIVKVILETTGLFDIFERIIAWSESSNEKTINK